MPKNIPDIHVLDHIDMQYFMHHGTLPELSERQGFGVEDMAMTASLKSRSANGIIADLEKVRAKGSAFFIDQFYKKYGHGSIGQNSGIIGIYAEKISILAAKALQDDKYYNGQESSSRYLDFGDMGYVVPEHLDDTVKEEFHRINDATMDLYQWALRETMVHLTETINPELIAGKTEAETANIVRARAFDICRGIIPAGARTYVAWHTLIETASRRIPELAGHTTAEVGDLAKTIQSQLHAKYPSSFDATIDPVLIEYHHANAQRRQIREDAIFGPAAFSLTGNIPAEAWEELCRLKPRRVRADKNLSIYGTLEWQMTIDYGSWRDLQRHRDVYVSEPLLTTELGFESWYLDNMPEHVAKIVRIYMYELAEQYQSLLSSCNRYDLQYIVPMGFRVQAFMVATLPQLVYIGELRTGMTVHPTARHAVQDMCQALTEMAVESIGPIRAAGMLSFNFNYEPSVISVRRGTQDIDGIRE